MNYVIPKSVTAEKLIFPYCHKDVMDIWKAESLT